MPVHAHTHAAGICAALDRAQGCPQVPADERLIARGGGAEECPLSSPRATLAGLRIGLNRPTHDRPACS
jgi:hypothetical protein